MKIYIIFLLVIFTVIALQLPAQNESSPKKDQNKKSTVLPISPPDKKNIKNPNDTSKIEGISNNPEKASGVPGKCKCD